MKKLPIFPALLIGLLGLTWLGLVQDAIPLFAQATPESQPESGQADQAGSPTKPALPEESPEALAVLQEARQKLFDRSSVQAKLRETVRMRGRAFHAEGEYFAGPYPKLRLNFKIELGETRAELLEVCDGQILWTVQKLDTPATEEPEEQVARTVIGDVLEAQQETLNVPETTLIAYMGIGGLPSLLAALERSMTFEALREMDVDGHPYSVIQGRWNDEIRNRFKTDKQEVQYPAYVPDHVRIYFDAQTSFPTRILYLKETEPGSRQYTALLSLEFWDVVLDGAVNDELFQYTPTDTTQVRDRTRDFLEMMKSAEESANTEQSPGQDAAAAPDQEKPADEK